MKSILRLACLGLVLSLGQTSFAGDVNAGKEKAQTCAACHGPDGNSTNPVWPKLAGQGEPYLIDQLQQFRDGKRENAQ
ncbi:MAG: c-type cytochrome, partial [Gammaproteobacteria bacterium]|nr:c-type cytochrome [Gammaproteobacteria bacterium]